jgi:autonomous glycyl radical cofactor GrcA
VVESVISLENGVDVAEKYPRLWKIRIAGYNISQVELLGLRPHDCKAISWL